MADQPNETEEPAAKVGGEAYQVIGALAHAAGLFEHPEVQRALDYFGYEQWRKDGAEILPFGAGLPDPDKG